MDAAATPNKPSGISRLSRLPVLRSRPSQSFTQTADGADGARNTSTTSKAPNRSVNPQAPQPGKATSRGFVASTVPSSLASSVNGARQVSKPATVPRAGLVRPPSQAKQQRVLPTGPKVAKTDDEENQDQLGPIDSFRTASRQGFRDEEVFEPLPYVETSEPIVSTQRKRSRPSLSDRTIESLQNIPATPKDRRRSSFFSPGSPMGPPPRPASALSRNGSSSSRPGTSDGIFSKPYARAVSPIRKAPASAKPPAKTALGGFGFTPKLESKARRSVSTTLTNRLQQSRDSSGTSPAVPSHSDCSFGVLPSGRASVRPTGRSKTVAARPTKPRPALAGAFTPKENKTNEAALTTHNGGSTQKGTKPSDTNQVGNSSTALREQIAAAKAAARKERAKHDSPQQTEPMVRAGPEVDMSADPFTQAPTDAKHVLRNRIRTALTDGKLNIAAMGLREIPKEVLNMYDAKAMEESHVNWAEAVDLTKLIAADNELESLDDKAFPDAAAVDLAEHEDTQGNQFGGLELLDLHGNALRSLPLGVRRLERLTHLNLAHNKLENSMLEVIAHIHPLKELRLGNNALSGHLPVSICRLRNLETLDVQANRLLGLPEALRELVHLKTLNVAGNQLTTLPMDALQRLPLVNLDASKNALIGSLFPLGGASAHATLQTLDVSNNSLAALTFSETLDLPELRTMDVTNNHLTILPSVLGCTNLVTLMAGDNKISELPAGLTALEKLRNVNFTGNQLRVLDPSIATMQSLEFLVLAGNPLRERKYLTMSAQDIKRDLRSKLEPAASEDGKLSDSESVIQLPGDHASPTSPRWTLRANGSLELGSKDISDNVDELLGSFFDSNQVKQLILQSNKLTAFPPALQLGQDLRFLDLSSNTLRSDYLSTNLELPALQELNLSNCRLTNLAPLITQLSAPTLHTLNLTANRLSGPLPALRTTYPELRTLLAGDNKFTSVSAPALRGLHVVNVGANEIEALPAEIGLLWDEGLRTLVVGGNAFRVPNYRVLEKGTEATMRWLRDRLPAAAADGGRVVGDELGGGV